MSRRTRDKRATARNEMRKSGADRLFGIITTVLVIILVAECIVFIYAIQNSSTRYITEPDDLLRYIDDGHYDIALDEVMSNRARGIDEEDDKAYIEPYAVADYFEATLDYRMYQENGESVKASEAKQRKDDAYERMGRMRFKQEEIDRIVKGE